jgi:hypothetical protein
MRLVRLFVKPEINAYALFTIRSAVEDHITLGVSKFMYF